jgi:peptidoglycan L-alanyl-D-glutamate endopeptidase CwlK
MPRFGKTSAANLATCHADLQTIMNELVKYQDVSVTCGRRGKSVQNDLFMRGKSTLRFPDSKHNALPTELSLAVDVQPYPVNWNDLGSFYMMVGRIKQIADQKGIKIRVGADWDMDGKTDDQKFNDCPHVELVL